MSVFSATNIQLRPVAIPVERYAGLVARVYIFELVEIDYARDRVGEETECYFVFGVGLCKKIVEGVPV